MYKFMIALCFLSVGCSEVCGDGVLESGEACDDGNTLNADGCETDCSLPACQNGIVDPGEVCFFAPVEIETDFGPQQIVAADLNRDGVLDLVTANTGFSLSVLLGDGFGGFSRLPDVELAQVTSVVAVGDLDGDGILDLASSLSEIDRIEVFRGLGDGSFAPLVTIPVIDPDSLVIVDLNGDKLLDLASTSDTGVAVFLNNGAGGFLGPRRSETGSPLFDLKSGDFNGDGSIDLITLINENKDSLLVLLGDGTGNFLVQTPQTAGEAGDLLVEDFNGDNALDLAVGRRSASEIGLLIGNDLGTFSEVQTLSILAPTGLAAGDVDGDGLLDIAVASDLDFKFSSHLGLFLGGSVGSFEALPLLPASGGNLGSIALADFNEDGALDAALTDQSNAQVIVFLSQP
jgi:cysteine-rich repeat protein